MTSAMRMQNRRQIAIAMGGITLTYLVKSRTAIGATFPQTATRAPEPSGIVALNGTLPDLAFRMTRVSDNQPVTARDYRGDVVIMYFGFTRCSDSCPLTTLNAARLFGLLGKDRAHTRFLFVTVDPVHDTPLRLRHYLAKFGPPPSIDGLYGTSAQLHALAERYAVYFTAPTGPDSPDPVSKIQHSDAVYLFGPQGRALALVNNLGGGHPQLEKLAQMIRSVL